MNEIAMLLHVPVLSRYDFGLVRSPGPGLGNLLFPIARALIGQSKYGGEFVRPTMRQFKVGTFLRNERDKRTYGDVLRGRSIKDWSLWNATRSLPKLSEQSFNGYENDVAVCYTSLGRFFHDLAGNRDLVADWLALNVRHSPPSQSYDIGLHVRLGDFSKKQTKNSGQSIQLPMSWYRAAYAEAADLLGERHPRAILFTDGNPSRVRDMLRIQGLRCDESADAIGAIIHLSQAHCIVASRSTFSMWAAFLGDPLGFWDQNFDLASAFPVRVDRDRFI